MMTRRHHKYTCIINLIIDLNILVMEMLSLGIYLKGPDEVYYKSI